MRCTNEGDGVTRTLKNAQAAQKSFETWAPHAYAETTSRDPCTWTRAAPRFANRTPNGARGAGGRSTTGVSSPAELSELSSSAVECSSSSDQGIRAAAPTAQAAPASSASERIPKTLDKAIESFGEESLCLGAARHVFAKAPFSSLWAVTCDDDFLANTSATSKTAASRRCNKPPLRQAAWANRAAKAVAC